MEWTVRFVSVVSSMECTHGLEAALCAIVRSERAIGTVSHEVPRLDDSVPVGLWAS